MNSLVISFIVEYFPNFKSLLCTKKLGLDLKKNLCRYCVLNPSYMLESTTLQILLACLDNLVTPRPLTKNERKKENMYSDINLGNPVCQKKVTENAVTRVMTKVPMTEWPAKE